MQKVLDPIDYYRLKSRILELMLNEREIAAQKQAAFAALGLPAGQYLFEDATTSVTILVPQAQVAAEEAAAAAVDKAPMPLSLVPDPPDTPEPAPEPPPAPEPHTEL